MTSRDGETGQPTRHSRRGGPKNPAFIARQSIKLAQVKADRDSRGGRDDQSTRQQKIDGFVTRNSQILPAAGAPKNECRHGPQIVQARQALQKFLQDSDTKGN